MKVQLVWKICAPSSQLGYKPKISLKCSDDEFVQNMPPNQISSIFGHPTKCITTCS